MAKNSDMKNKGMNSHESNSKKFSEWHKCKFSEQCKKQRQECKFSEQHKCKRFELPQILSEILMYGKLKTA